MSDDWRLAITFGGAIALLVFLVWLLLVINNEGAWWGSFLTGW